MISTDIPYSPAAVRRLLLRLGATPRYIGFDYVIHAIILSLEDSQAVDDYITKTNLIAQHECEHLYVQGAKDCVEMLKKIGVL